MTTDTMWQMMQEIHVLEGQKKKEKKILAWILLMITFPQILDDWSYIII